MHLCDLQPKSYPWGTDGERAWLEINLAEANQVDRSMLTEMTYKDLIAAIDPNFLNQKVRAEALNGIQYIGFDPPDTMNFYINSSEYKDNKIKYTME